MITSDATELTSRVRGLAEEAAAARDLFIVDVQVRGQKGSRVIEVFVDSDEGAGLDELAAMSREIDFVLETEDVIKGRYHLNVSSPGADRPLTMPRQFRKHVGRQLRVETGSEDEPQSITGTLTSVDDEAMELDVDGRPTTLSFDQVREARIVLPW